jgi:purine-binding chemotaxis protein CheW
MNDFFNFISEFLTESDLQITEIRKNIPALTEALKKGDIPSFEDNSKLLRAVHSINGGSSFAGLDDVEAVSNKLERMIYYSVSGKVRPDDQMAQIIEKTVAVLEAGLKNGGKIRKREWSKLEKEIDKLFFSGESVSLKDQEAEIDLSFPEPVSIPEEILKVTVSEKEYDIEETEESLTNKYVSFKIGTEYYAVPIEFVYDMKEMLPCSRIPNQPNHFLGVANLRGNVVPVIDLRKIFGFNEVKYDQFTVFLMLRVEGKIKGCVVDSIDDVVFLEPENTQITPALSRKIKNDFVKFIAKEPKTERFLIVIDVEKMLENE